MNTKNIKESMDRNLYNSALHLIEAAKYMSDVNQGLAVKLGTIADRILSIVDAPEEKMSRDQLSQVLSEILNSEN